MKKVLKYSLLILVISLCSCEKWLDIKPSDRLSEEMVFSDREGYLKALNGVYVELTSTSLYGQNLSAGILDVMAQYYNAASSSTYAYYYYQKYTYTNASVKGTFDNIWQKSYQLIANCNTIIEKCGDSNELLSEQYFGIIKGEALALRAMLHMDLLRIFGPIYSQGSTTPAIPYMKTQDHEIQPLLSSEMICENIIKDLTEAMNLLSSADPVITAGVKNNANSSGDNSLNYRQYRLNFYAVKALLARTYLWKGDKENAFRVSEEIINSVQIPGSQIFPFVTSASATSSTIPDRVFSTEVLFSLYSSNRVQMHNALFLPTLEVNRRLSFAGTLTDGRVNELYDDKNDYRYKIWSNYNNNGTNVLYHRKFEDMSDTQGASNAWRYMVPLIRLSEVFLIAAESSSELATSVLYLNKVRNSKSCFSVTPASYDILMNYVTQEYRKEMLGEGQLFFYYKRRALQNVPNGALAAGNVNVALTSYVVPLPDSEISQRIN
ncbi:MAG: hypothetical protein CVU10_08240 [Bacteroidetes bacterium HGW-Bacteroidetes-5]|jgi:hypothetical protein|nr:MAG: hypothetical protein CVU10_08240 [Bacteroidetes bacterium HGW-Bacteroidetes-5]